MSRSASHWNKPWEGCRHADTNNCADRTPVQQLNSEDCPAPLPADNNLLTPSADSFYFSAQLESHRPNKSSTRDCFPDYDGINTDWHITLIEDTRVVNIRSSASQRDTLTARVGTRIPGGLHIVCRYVLCSSAYVMGLVVIVVQM